MEATDILMGEHRIIERVIAAIEIAASALEQGKAVRPEFFLQAADFIKNFADGSHHQKEEGVLFEAMIQNGMSAEGGPVGVMLYEHEQGRAFTRAMRTAAQAVKEGRLEESLSIVQNAMGYAKLLRQHILKEDRVLYPMAEQLLPVDRQHHMLEEFNQVDHTETGEDVHEKYLALADALVKEAASLSEEA